jgi:membrane protein DedA with SNARE-associated domain
VTGFIGWLSHAPLALLYLIMAAFAAVENVFPPIPADTVVALGSWLAARGQGSPVWAFLSVWIGNIAGAAGMYFVGRRHGTAWIERRFPKIADAQSEHRFRELHRRYGAASIFLSRFIPGVRALVPPFAGALRLPVVSSLASIALASGIWYGLVSYLAFRAGAAAWNALNGRSSTGGRWIAVGAGVGFLAGELVWWVRRRRNRREPT